MTTVLNTRQERDFFKALLSAGLTEELAQRVIDSKNGGLAIFIVTMLKRAVTIVDDEAAYNSNEVARYFEESLPKAVARMK